MSPPGVLCVFAKAPERGCVKTRLARALGPAAAADLSRAFLLDTWSLATRFGGARPVLALAGDPTALPPLSRAPDLHAQGEGDLGTRMERALSHALSEGAPWAMVLGADLPGLPATRLAQAARALEQGAPAVVGPSDDGGFYLLGVSRCPPGLLAGLPWSDRFTCRRTLERLRERGLEPRLIDGWYDVDELDDLERLRRDLRIGRAHAPRTARALARALPRISVVLPVLDEEARIARRLDELSAMPGIDEILVVDGGSRDRTAAIAEGHTADHLRLLSAPRGRGLQMNTGARAARGSVLLFLHADSQLPGDAVHWIESALADRGTVAGAFRTWHVVDDRRRRRAPWLHLADLRSRLSRTPYGDQALFVRHDVFDQVGGFPPIELMEDLELSRRLRRRGSVRVVPASVRVSGRRFLAHPLRDTLLVNTLPVLYRCGVPPALLARVYRDTR